ncbi:MAG: thioredoxin fold domain-containing protein [Pseudomonadota bacterium]
MFRSRLPKLLFVVLSLFLSGCSEARDALPAAVDLRADGQLARVQRLPIVLFFHSTTCPFCREVEDLYLTRLQRENERVPQFLLRTVEISQTQPLVAFDGTRTDQRAFAKRQGVTLVPHLRFLGPDGEALAPDLVGLTPRDFYGAYLEGSINSAGEKLRRIGR